MLDGKEDQYWKRAQECFRVAEQMNHDDLRKQYLRLAECYLELAEANAALRSGDNAPKRSDGSDQLGT